MPRKPKNRAEFCQIESFQFNSHPTPSTVVILVQSNSKVNRRRKLFSVSNRICKLLTNPMLPFFVL